MAVDTKIHVVLADLNDASQGRAIARIVDNYARDPMGGGQGLPPDVLEEMIPALKQAPSARVFLAYVKAAWAKDDAVWPGDSSAAAVSSCKPKVAGCEDCDCGEGSGKIADDAVATETAPSIASQAEAPVIPPVPVTYESPRRKVARCSGCLCLPAGGPEGYVACGVAVCFVGCSTWAARPVINVHDLAVDPAYRRRGVGKALLEGVKQFGQSIGACKVTLEVREDNTVAQTLYKNLGFGEATVPMKFWICKLDEEL